MRDQRVGHARVVLGPLHEPAAAGDDLLDGIVEQPLEDGVVLPQAGEQRLGALERAGAVKRPLRRVGLARRLVALEVAEPLALLAQAPLGRGVGDHLGRRRRRVGVGNVREARRRAAALLGDAAHEQAAGALLHGRALDGVDAEVEAKVGEARQRDALLRVLRRHRCSGCAWGRVTTVPGHTVASGRSACAWAKAGQVAKALGLRARRIADPLQYAGKVLGFFVGAREHSARAVPWHTVASGRSGCALAKP